MQNQSVSPPEDLAERVAFGMKAPCISMIVTEKASGRSLIFSAFKKIQETGNYVTWSQMNSGWLPSVTCQKNGDLKIIICTKEQSHQIGTSSLRDCHVLVSGDNVCERILKIVREWHVAKLQI